MYSGPNGDPPQLTHFALSPTADSSFSRWGVEDRLRAWAIRLDGNTDYLPCILGLTGNEPVLLEPDHWALLLHELSDLDVFDVPHDFST
jgi:hypothetical protein